MSNLTSVITQLKQERTRLASQLERLNGAISALNGASGNRTRRGTMSVGGRARIAAAQRARWAKVKGRKSFHFRHKRRMSPAARRRIAADRGRAGHGGGRHKRQARNALPTPTQTSTRPRDGQ